MHLDFQYISKIQITLGQRSAIKYNFYYIFFFTLLHCSVNFINKCIQFNSMNMTLYKMVTFMDCKLPTQAIQRRIMRQF